MSSDDPNPKILFYSVDDDGDDNDGLEEKQPEAMTPFFDVFKRTHDTFPDMVNVFSGSGEEDKYRHRHRHK